MSGEVASIHDKSVSQYKAFMHLKCLMVVFT